MAEFTKVVYIEGDGVGPEITPVMRAVLDAAMDKAYGGEKAIAWEEAYAGGKAEMLFGTNLPESTLRRIREVGLAIKGPLMTPVGKGARSINVALRQNLDLYVCLRPVCYFHGVPSPVRHPEKVDMVVFRENTEDIYAGIPSIRNFSNELAVHMRWPKYWSYSFSISPSNEYSGLISLRMDWLDLLAV